MATTDTSYSYMEIRPDELGALDLCQEAEALRRQGVAFQAYTITVDMHPVGAQALHVPSIGRLGVAWGADATWADVPDVDTGLAWWVNDHDEWDAHN